MGGIFRNKQFIFWASVATIVLVLTTLSNYVECLAIIGPITMIAAILIIFGMFIFAIINMIKSRRKSGK